MISTSSTQAFITETASEVTTPPAIQVTPSGA